MNAYIEVHARPVHRERVARDLQQEVRRIGLDAQGQRRIGAAIVWGACAGRTGREPRQSPCRAPRAASPRYPPNTRLDQ